MHKVLPLNRLRDEKKGGGRISMRCGQVIGLIPGVTIFIENSLVRCDMCYCEFVLCVLVNL